MNKIKKTLAGLLSVMTVATTLCMPSAFAADTANISEGASNNTLSAATDISANTIATGTINYASDEDYYAFTPSTSNGTGYYDITLSVPAGKNYNYAIYDSEGSLLTTIANRGAGIGEHYNRYFIGGNTYYIKVYSSSGSSSSLEYKLYISSCSPLRKTWYSQIESNVNNHEWNNNGFSNLTCNGVIFMDDNYSTKGDVMHSGCAITSIAMVLHNLRATTVVPITDFRTGFYGYTYADPFTVYMAHNNFTTAPVNNSYSPSYDINLQYETVNGVNTVKYIGDYFGKTIIVNSGDINDAKAELSSHPEGVIIRFPGHYAVMSPANNSDGYVIFDPGTRNEIAGNGVAFDSSYSHTGFGYDRDDVYQYLLIE